MQAIYQLKSDPLTIYQRIPAEEQRSAGQPNCTCKNPNCTNTWDTLATYLGEDEPRQWRVHWPELETSDLVRRIVGDHE